METRHFLVMAVLLACILPLLACIFQGCSLEDEAIKLPFEGYTPEQLPDGWEISTPEQEGFDRSKIDRVYEMFFSEELYPTAHSLLIVRHGKLVAEAYCRDKAERDTFHHLQSATKTITSLLLGIAMDKGLVESVEEPVYRFLPEHFDDGPRKQAITLFDVLTMQTGLHFDNDDDTATFFHDSGDSLEFVLHRDLDFTPGTSFYYHDGNPQLISGVIQKVSGMTEEAFAIENLFKPLGIHDYQWESHADGRSFGAFGLWLRPRDMAKIGRMVAQNGTWNGEQIVSSEWLAESTKVYANTNYGYYWWIVEGNKVFYAEGHGGQLIFVVPEQDLVVVRTTDPDSAEWKLSPGMGDELSAILDAIVE